MLISERPRSCYVTYCMVWPRILQTLQNQNIHILYKYCLTHHNGNIQPLSRVMSQTSIIKSLVKIIICKNKKQEKWMVTLENYYYTYFVFYVVIKIKHIVQVAKSRGYISWSRDLKGHVGIHAIWCELCLLLRTSRNKISLCCQRSTEQDHTCNYPFCIFSR